MVEYKARRPAQPATKAGQKAPTPPIKPAAPAVAGESKAGVAEGRPAPGGESAPAPAAPARKPEIGGPKGPEPTRYGDWEKGGRCIDF